MAGCNLISVLCGYFTFVQNSSDFFVLLSLYLLLSHWIFFLSPHLFPIHLFAWMNSGFVVGSVEGHDELAAEGAAVIGIFEEGGLASLLFFGGFRNQRFLFGLFQRLTENGSPFGG